MMNILYAKNMHFGAVEKKALLRKCCKAKKKLKNDQATVLSCQMYLKKKVNSKENKKEGPHINVI